MKKIPLQPLLVSALILVLLSGCGEGDGITGNGVTRHDLAAGRRDDIE
jgi:hypothetical protein